MHTDYKYNLIYNMESESDVVNFCKSTSCPEPMENFWKNLIIDKFGIQNVVDYRSIYIELMNKQQNINLIIENLKTKVEQYFYNLHNLDPYLLNLLNPEIYKFFNENKKHISTEVDPQLIFYYHGNLNVEVEINEKVKKIFKISEKNFIMFLFNIPLSLVHDVNLTYYEIKQFDIRPPLCVRDYRKLIQQIFPYLCIPSYKATFLSLLE